MKENQAISNDKSSDKVTCHSACHSAADLSQSNQSFLNSAVSCGAPDPTPATLLREWGQGPQTTETVAEVKKDSAAADKSFETCQRNICLDLSLVVPVEKQKRPTGTTKEIGQSVPTLPPSLSRSLIKITERDKTLIQYTGEQGFLTFDQICRFFFLGDPGNASRRIKKLMELKLLKFYSVQTLQGTTRVLRLTPRGLKVYQENYGKRIPKNRRIGFSSFIHDVLVNESRFRLLNHWDGVWVPECYLKSEEYPQIPDGLVYFKDTKHTVAVEVENSLKSAERYEAIFKRWAKGDIFLALYIATSSEVYNGVKNRILSLAPNHIPIGLVSWQELSESTPDVWTVRGSLPVLRRRVL